MKTLKDFTKLKSYSEIELSYSEMNSVRGGTSGGVKVPFDEDILIPDPEPGDGEPAD
jgi:natural product precursor